MSGQAGGLRQTVGELVAETPYFDSLLFVFFPNVWFFGGTAFSDLPGLALLLAASATLLRGFWSSV